MKVPSLCWLLMLVLLSPSCATPRNAPIARYTRGVITQKEVTDWLRYKQRQGIPAAQSNAIESIAVLKSLAHDAKRSGVDKKTNVRLQLRDIETQPLARALERHVHRSIVVDEAEVDKKAVSLQPRLAKPKRLYLHNLFKRFPENVDESQRLALRTRMQAIRKELLAGAEFADLAKRESDSQTRFRGGRMGVVRPGDFLPHIERAAMALSEGEISQVLETDSGLTILRCDRIFPPIPPPPLKDVRQRIRRRLRQERFEKRWREIKDSLSNDTSIDMTALQDPDSAADATVAHSPSLGKWTRADILELLRLRGIKISGVERNDRVASTAHSTVVAWVIQLRAAQEATRQGLELTPSEIENQRWKVLEVLASNEVARRVQLQLQPVSDDQVRNYFEENAPTYRHPTRYRLLAISRTTPANKVTTEYELMSDILYDIRSGHRTFEQAARELSQLPSARNGGDLGWLTARQLAAIGPIVAKAIESLRSGETSDLIQQRESVGGTSSLWILHLVDRQQARRMTFAEAADLVRTELMNTQARRLARDIKKAVASRIELTIEQGTRLGTQAE